MGVFIGLCIAAGLGVWAYSDAKNLERQGIQVGSFSAVGWGCLVALVAIVFGIMYLVQRPQAIATARSFPGMTQAEHGSAMPPPPPPPPPSPPPPRGATPEVRQVGSEPDAARTPPPPLRDTSVARPSTHRYCDNCGAGMRAEANYCPACGRPTERSSTP